MRWVALRVYMKNLLINLLFFFVGLLMAGGMVFLFLRDSGKADAAEIRSELKVRRLSVNTMFVEPGQSFSIDRRFRGVLRSKKAVELGFSRPGKIEEILVRPGQTVRDGQVLAKLESGTELDAPFDGSISARLTAVGALVSPGVPVVRMLDPDDLEALVNVPADFAADIQNGEPYELEIGGDVYLIAVTGVSPVIDEITRTRTVLFTLPERVSNEHLHGESASVEITKVIDKKGFWVPVTALSQEIRGSWMVYIAVPVNDTDYRVQREYVDVIHAEDDKVWINGPISPEVHLIPDGIHRVVPGQIVSIAAK